jgi:hypothetical protein
VRRILLRPPSQHEEVKQEPRCRRVGKSKLHPATMKAISPFTRPRLECRARARNGTPYKKHTFSLASIRSKKIKKNRASLDSCLVENVNPIQTSALVAVVLESVAYIFLGPNQSTGL